MEPMMLDVPQELTTARLLLRAPRAGDGEIVNAAVQESAAELAAWMPWATPTPRPQDTELWIRQAAAKFITRDMVHFNLYERNGQRYVGGCSALRFNWDVRAGEIGYWLRTSAWGKGYMTEAVNALAELGFGALKLQRLEIRCDERNQRSAAVAGGAPLNIEGTLRHDSLDPKGELRSTRIYAKLAGD